MENVKENYFTANGIDLCYFEWGQQYQHTGQTLLFVHANGFHARVWDSVIRGMPGFHIIAVDLRGHGRSEQTPIEHWNVFAEDLSALITELDLQDITGVGHSLGGHVLTEAAASHEERFRHLILIDPAIIAPDDYNKPSSSAAIESPEHHPAARRRDRFDTPEAMIERFKDREPYSLFTTESFENYCRYGLLKDDEGYRLACHPVTEASVYMASRSNEYIYNYIRQLELPVLIMRAMEPTKDNPREQYSSSPTFTGLVNEFRHAREIHYADKTHFLPMEIPVEISQRINEFIQP
ncbi:MAG: alpha/beta hydrolase [Gammaproteobacteria bacterium]|nr:alpha/beta hydrolase [Gammaproteobacteria bacterium]MBT4494112.1 alpha/beta hydrolase [Gammaproteobacteria bacterium]